jgi:hypothetical protein
LKIAAKRPGVPGLAASADQIDLASPTSPHQQRSGPQAEGVRAFAQTGWGAALAAHYFT